MTDTITMYFVEIFETLNDGKTWNPCDYVYGLTEHDAEQKTDDKYCNADGISYSGAHSTQVYDYRVDRLLNGDWSF